MWDRRLLLALAASLLAHLSLLLIELPQPEGADRAEPLSVNLRQSAPDPAAAPAPVATPVPLIPPVAPRAPKPAGADKPQDSRRTVPLLLPDPQRDEDLGRGAYAVANLSVTPREAPAPPQGYANLEELDQPPLPVRAIAPVFPRQARSQRHRGHVRVEMLISERGQVESVVVKQADTLDFVEAALAALRRASFRPGEIGGRPVAARIHYDFHFGYD